MESCACIYRVPWVLREQKKTAYTPHLVSIGPFHSKDDNLARMQNIKRSYTNSLFRRLTDGSEGAVEILRNKCLEEMKNLKEKAKKYYAEQVEEELNEEMLVIDGCFILELLYCNFLIKQKRNEKQKEKSDNSCKDSSQTHKEKLLHPEENESRDPIFGSIPTFLTIQQDLLLLENQLPFFVLGKLFSLTVNKIPNRTDHFCLHDYLIEFVPRLERESSNKTPTNCSPPKPTKNPTNCCLPSDCVLSLCCCRSGPNLESKGTQTSDYKNAEVKHILHFLHSYYLPADPKKEQLDPPECMPSASDLNYAGVEFQKASTDRHQDIFQVKFKRPQNSFFRAQLGIPTLCIDDSAERLLRNLIALEQCCPGVRCFVTSYAFLMDRLINTAKDVDVLQKAGIIRNYLGANEEASDIFNKLSKEVELGEFSYAQTCKDAAEYSKLRLPRLLAYPRNKYFANPWTFIAFCIAFIVFGMTAGTFIRNMLR